MLAIKNCHWKVVIRILARKEYYWVAENENSGALQVISLIIAKSKILAEEDWKQFAKLNGITNWEYVK